MAPKKKKSYVPIAKIKNALRRIYMHDKQRKKALDRAKVDKATYSCESCGKFLYDGSSDKNFNALREKYSDKEVVKEKPDVDHKTPVIEPKRGFCDWNTYIESLWCSAEDLQILCKFCHLEKTSKEAAERKEAGTLKRKK